MIIEMDKRRVDGLKAIGYEHPRTVDAAVIEIANYFAGIKPSVRTYESGSGSAEKRMSMSGNVPVVSHGKNIEIQIWLPLTYPATAPTVYLRITPTTIINPAGIVNKHGMVQHDYINQWQKDSNLLDMLQTLIIEFNTTLPTFELSGFFQSRKAIDSVNMVMMYHPELQLSWRKHESGKHHNLEELTLEGLVAVTHPSGHGIVPLRIYLPHTFPKTAPRVFVIPHGNITVKVKHNYIKKWRHPGCNLVDLMGHLIAEFSQHLPVSVPKQTSPSHSISGSSLHLPPPSATRSPAPAPAPNPFTKDLLTFVNCAGLADTTTRQLVENGFTSLRALLATQDDDLEKLGISMAEVCLLRKGLQRLRQSRKERGPKTSQSIEGKSNASSDPPDVPAKPSSDSGNMLCRALHRLLGPLIVTDDELDIKEEIGRGEYGVVYRAVLHRKDSPETEEVAVKTMVLSGNDATKAEDLVHEILQMRTFNHRNIVGLRALLMQGKTPQMLLPYMAKGDLRNYISNPKQSFTIEDLLSMALDVTNGMKYLSDQRYVHGDLAARNCLVDEKCVVKVGDFGLSRQLHQSEYYELDPNRTRPVRWMAPESLQDIICTIKSDVWSFGVLFWELLTRGKTPYPDVKNVALLPDMINKGHRLKCPEYAPEAVYEIMLNCWTIDEAKRPCFGTIIAWIETLMAGDSQQTDQTRMSYAGQVPSSLTPTGTAIRHSSRRITTARERSPPPPLPPRVPCTPNTPGDYGRRRSDGTVSLGGLPSETPRKHSMFADSRHSDSQFVASRAYFESTASSSALSKHSSSPSNRLSPLLPLDNRSPMSAADLPLPPPPPRPI